MKTITFKNDNGRVYVEIGEEEPGQPTQQITIGHNTLLNRKWSRNIQLSNEYVFIKRYGCPTVGMHVDDLIALAIAIEPKLSWPPVFTKLPESVTVKSGESSTMIVEVAVGELPITYQWQTSTDGKEWADIPGQESATLSETNAGQYRCVATNGAGSTSTVGAILTVQG